MTYSVVVEKNKDSYRARTIGWPDCVAVGGSRGEVLEQVKDMLRDQLSEVEIVSVELDIPQPPHPILEFAGVFKDDPFFDDVQTEIAAYRRELDEDEEVP